jgi:hypothetical protein
MRAVRVVVELSCLAATLAVANSTQLSANQVIAHYVDIGDQGQSRLLAADGAGNLFVVSTIIEPWGRPQIPLCAGSPEITKTTFPACRAQYPGGPNRCLSVSSPFVRPSPVNRRVGIHDFTFEACSSFTRVTACSIACPPKSGLLSRGFDLASCPTKPLLNRLW